MNKTRFISTEYLLLLLTAFVSAFILTFNEWGGNQFDFRIGFANLVFAFLIVTISIYIKLAVQKYFSKDKGYEVVFKPWVIGFLLAIIFIMVSNGSFIFLAFGGVVFYVSEKLKLGKRNIDLKEIGWLAILGPITSLMIALIAKLVFYGDFAAKIISINMWLALFAIIPIPFVHKFKVGGEKNFGTSDGLKFLYSSPMEYFIISILLIIDSIAIVALPNNIAVAVTIIVMLMIWAIYQFFYKQNIFRKREKAYLYRS